MESRDASRVGAHSIAGDRNGPGGRYEPATLAVRRGREGGRLAPSSPHPPTRIRSPSEAVPTVPATGMKTLSAEPRHPRGAPCW
jgi:hypothetical protein